MRLEAAYREGWADGYDGGYAEGVDGIFGQFEQDSDWQKSEARAALKAGADPE
jgi:hypothetical protein